MSAVHVFFKDKMTAVGHLVGADQLPLPQLVSTTCHVNVKNGKKTFSLGIRVK
jgi:hypothetical protein